MKKHGFAIVFAFILCCTPIAFAKNFYGEMKKELSARSDLQKHYKFHKKLGSIMRFAPSEYQILGIAGMTTLSFIFKEVFWDLILRQGTFDMKDAAANFKGLKDGMNGVNELEKIIRIKGKFQN